MQLSVTFKGNNIVMPIAGSETVQGLIYKAISRDTEYSLKVHQNGKVFDDRKYKLFTFSELKGKYTVKDKEIVYESEAQLQISSTDPYFIQLLIVYFSANSQVSLGTNKVEPTNLRLTDTRNYENEITVMTLSPITVYITDNEKHTHYFSPDDPQFYLGIVANARRKWASFHGGTDGFELEIKPMDGHKYIKRVTRFKNTFITAWHGKFMLKGTPQTLDFLLQTGLGSKNSQGFGMITMFQQ